MGTILWFEALAGHRTREYSKRKLPNVTTDLEVNSFAETDAVDSEGARIAKELKRITNAIASPQSRTHLQREEREDADSHGPHPFAMLLSEVGLSGFQDYQLFYIHMITLVKLQRKGQMTLPSRLRKALGVEEGDLIEATIERGKVVLTPKVLIDRSNFPSADSDYTPAQRRVIDTRLAEAEADIKSGRVHGPFNTHKEMMAFLNKGVSKGRTAKTTRSKK